MARVATVLAALSLVSFTAAGFFGSAMSAMATIDREWTLAAAVEEERAEVEAALEVRRASGDRAVSAQHLREIERESEAIWDGVARRVRGVRVLDPGARRARGEVIAAVDLLRGAAGAAVPVREERRGLIDRVSELVDGELRRLRIEPAAERAVPLPAVEAAWVALSDFSLVELHGRLLARNIRGDVVYLDVGGSTRRVLDRRGPDGGGPTAIRSAGSLVVIERGGVSSGHATKLEGAGLGPAVWEHDGRLIDTTTFGDVLLRAPRSTTLVSADGETTVLPDLGWSGVMPEFLIASRESIEVWKPGATSPERTTGEGGRFVGTAAGLVLWQQIEPPRTLHAVDAASGEAVAAVDLINDIVVAVSERPGRDTGVALGVRSLGTARVRVEVWDFTTSERRACDGPGARTADGPALAWSGDGRVLFWLADPPRDVPADIADDLGLAACTVEEGHVHLLRVPGSGRFTDLVGLP